MLKVILVSTIVSCYCSFCYVAAYALNYQNLLKQSAERGEVVGWGCIHYLGFAFAPVAIPIVWLFAAVRAYKQTRAEQKKKLQMEVLKDPTEGECNHPGAHTSFCNYGKRKK